jgi:hypothetical protein
MADCGLGEVQSGSGRCETARLFDRRQGPNQGRIDIHTAPSLMTAIHK